MEIQYKEIQSSSYLTTEMNFFSYNNHQENLNIFHLFKLAPNCETTAKIYSIHTCYPNSPIQHFWSNMRSRWCQTNALLWLVLVKKGWNAWMPQKKTKQTGDLSQVIETQSLVSCFQPPWFIKITCNFLITPGTNAGELGKLLWLTFSFLLSRPCGFIFLFSVLCQA